MDEELRGMLVERIENVGHDLAKKPGAGQCRLCSLA
jgi:hypothetical protein